MKKYAIISGLILVFSCQTPAPETDEMSAPSIDYYKQGQDITAIAQAELLKNVKESLEKGGPSYAIKYCNIHATPLSDSLSKHFNCQINRVSLKNRNPTNAPSNTKEKILLNNFIERSIEGGSIHDTVIADEGKLFYYRPILIGSEACLKCHGQAGKEISVETMASLSTLYPEDKAVNYRMGDFRGVWRIQFPLPEN